MKLTKRYTLYHPSTIGNLSAPEILEDAKASVERQAAALAKLFGGCTVTQGQGIWIDGDGNPVNETVWLLTSYASAEDASKHEAIVFLIARTVKEQFAQESIALEIDGTLNLL
jgi:hypothetical protein